MTEENQTTPYTQLPLAEPLQRAIADVGYTHATPIQARAIPVVLAGQDVLGAAQTGTGKTAAFSLPLLQRLLRHENDSLSPARHPVRALILLPTRELANQVAEQIQQYARYTELRSAVVFGGMNMKLQTDTLRKGVEILIATPGRLLDHIESKNVILNQVEYVVLDEADRMLDIGFLPDLERILTYLPKQRTTLLFSATFSSEIKKLSASYLNNPTTIEVARNNATASTVKQRFIRVADDAKRSALTHLIQQTPIRQAFIFNNSKLGCARLARYLERDGYKTAALHGDKSQEERLKALEAFQRNEVEFLVCTDVAARGLDIKDVPVVCNFDIPFNAEDYVHRIGRTGRAGAEGLAISLVSEHDQKLLDSIAKLIQKDIQPEHLSIEASTTKKHNQRSRKYSDSENTRSRSNRQGDHYQRPKKVADPFFSQPYTPSTGAEPAAWEKTDPPKRPATLRTSNNIRAKKPTAALFQPADKNDKS